MRIVSWTNMHHVIYVQLQGLINANIKTRAQIM